MLMTRTFNHLTAIGLCALGLGASAAVHASDSDAESGDRAASAVAHGDFNGDGYEDVATGSRWEDVGGVADAGAVDVIYGGSGGLDRTYRQFWTLDVTDVNGAAEAAGRFGIALAAADFNADGYDDLAIGAAGATVDGVDDAGTVSVIYGSASGLSATAVPDQRWHQNSPEVEETAEPGDWFGSALAAGDFNADGYADLAIGASGETLSAKDDAGEVNVIYGSASGLSATAVRDQRWNQDVNNVEDVVEAGDLFGAALTTGDFNADGYDDLAVGVPGESVNGLSTAGAVNVIYGAASGLSATTFSDQRWNQDVTDVEDASEAYDSFGAALASGDFNADGYDDLAIGVPDEQIGGAVDAGAANVIYGSATGLSATAVRDQRWHQDVNNVEDVVEAYDNFAWSLAVADFNADGYDDIALGVRHESVNARSWAGAVNVLYGAPSGVSATAVPDQRWHQDIADVEDVAEANDASGSAIAAADFNADGYADLVIGAPSESVVCWSGPIDEAGAFAVLYGATQGLSATTVPDQFWTQPCP